jgi:hypothetical protein
MDNRIRWTGYEFEYKEKTNDWFWAVGIIIISISIISFIYENAIFGLFILLAGAMALMTAKKPPRLIDYELTEKGLLINDKTYSHLDFRAFWVTEDKYSAPKLLLRANKIVNPILVITIETDYVDAEAVRDFLLDYIPEEKMEEPLSMRLMEFLGF